MKLLLLSFTLLFGLTVATKAQSNTDQTNAAPIWTEVDRKYLLENLIRTKQALIDEAKDLTKEQWDFKETSERWSINQIVEHIALYEVILLNEISIALQMRPFPELTHFVSDSIFLDQDPEGLKQNNTLDYTKPFSYSVPLGNNEGKNNLIWLTKMHDEAIAFVKSETRNLRVHYINFGANVHQNVMIIIKHNDRHVRQIKKVKGHPAYPK